MSKQKSATKTYDVDFKVVEKRRPLKINNGFLVSSLLFALGVLCGFLIWYNPDLHEQNQAYQISAERLQSQNRILRAKLAASEANLRNARQEIGRGIGQVGSLSAIERQIIAEENQELSEDPDPSRSPFQSQLDQADAVAKRARAAAFAAQKNAERNLQEAQEISRKAREKFQNRGASPASQDLVIAHIFKVRNPGNRLEDLARHYGISMTKLKQANPDLALQITQQGHFLRVGSEVLIPE